MVIPTFRRDIEGRADLAEELARIKGYDAIPTTLPTGAIPEAMPEPYSDLGESGTRGAHLCRFPGGDHLYTRRLRHRGEADGR